MTTFEDRISVLQQLGVREEFLPRLKKYVHFLWESNEDLNLISRQMSFQDLLDNHVIDCLLPLSAFPKSIKNVADFGSGGGLPAVIYAILFPEVQFHLYEKSAKKQQFLQQCQAFASNMHIHAEIPKELPAIDLLMARGFKPIDVILDMSRAYVQKSGRYFLLKARREKIQEELDLAGKKFKSLKVQIVPLKSPVLEVERHLVLIGF